MGTFRRNRTLKATGSGGAGETGAFLPVGFSFWDMRAVSLVISDCKCVVCS